MALHRLIWAKEWCEFQLVAKSVRVSDDAEEKSNDKPGRLCLTCGKEYEGGAFCPADGSPLSGENERLRDIMTIGNYEVIAPISFSGNSAVYKARHQLMDRLVAIKVLTDCTPQSLKRFHLEAQLASKLKHRNIVTIYDFGVSRQGQAFLAMDYLEGKTLEQIIADSGPIDFEQALCIFTQICDAVTYAHKQGLVHRDIKPGNFMVVPTESGEDLVQLIDFGIAKRILLESEEAQRLSVSGEVLGSPLYMSPEQCRGEKLDLRSDIYSLGCVMYEVLTGKVPLKGDTPVETINKHINEAPRSFTSVDPSLLRIPEPMEKIVFKAMERDLDKRYQSIIEMWTDLEVLLNATRHEKQFRSSGHNVQALRAEFVPPLKVARARRRAAATMVLKPLSRPNRKAQMAAVVLVLAVCAAGFAFTHRAPPIDDSLERLAKQWQKVNAQGEEELDRGHYQEADQDLREACKLAEQFDPDDARLAVSLHNMGNLYYRRDLYREAERCFKRALTIRRKSLGDDALAVADTMTDLGMVYIAEARLDDAQNLLNQAMDIRKAKSTPDSPDTADSLNAFAALYGKTNRTEEAIKLLQQVVQSRKKFAGEDDASVAEAQVSLAIKLQVAGDLNQAKEMYQSALAIARKNFGEVHPLIADCDVGLGSIDYLQHRYEEASKQFQNALSIREQTLGEDSLRTGEVLACLGVVQQAKGQYAKSETLLKQALDIKSAALGPDNKEVRRSMKVYAQVLRKLGRVSEAREYEERAKG